MAKLFGVLGVLVLGTLGVLIALRRYSIRISSGDPQVWEKAIRAFEAEDQHTAPLAHPIVFTGSSSIRFWHTLQHDMAPLAVLNRGFGGSQIGQVTYYADRIVLPYAPSAVVFYAGENDLAFENLTAQQVPGAFQQFCQKIHAALPEIPIYFISIKPPKRRRKYWPLIEQANSLVRAACSADPRLHYVDIVPSMLDASGNVKGDLFKWDGVHLNAKGYALWTARVKPLLLADFPPIGNRPAINIPS